jgi:hypothetical protein
VCRRAQQGHNQQHEQELEDPPAPMSFALQSHLMEPAELLAEIGDILAAGLMRLKLGKSSQLCSELGESSLDFSAPESGHPTPGKEEKIG